MLRLVLVVSLSVPVVAAAQQVSSCTAQTCGTWTSVGAAPATCRMNTAPFACRTGSGCSCESNCPLYGDCCLQFDPICTAPVAY
ncbi:MAG: hypothetical protein ABTQ32_06530, partial [Myxococcaceae bacterium]